MKILSPFPREMRKMKKVEAGGKRIFATEGLKATLSPFSDYHVEGIMREGTAGMLALLRSVCSACEFHAFPCALTNRGRKGDFSGGSTVIIKRLYRSLICGNFRLNNIHSTLGHIRDSFPPETT